MSYVFETVALYSFVCVATHSYNYW